MGRRDSYHSSWFGFPVPRVKFVFKCPMCIFQKRQDQQAWPSTHWPSFKTNIFKTSSSEPFACENKLFNLNTLKFKDTKLVFCCKDLTLPVQISYPNQTKFQFPTCWACTRVKCPWAAGGGRSQSFKLIST